MSEFTRVVYLSSNSIDVQAAEMLGEIDKILKVSQENNQHCGVTGALIFNRGFFGQILEGPADAVDETFERIQNDDRHHNISLLEARPIEQRSFENWSMGFVGSEHALERAFHRSGAASGFSLDRISADDMFGVLKDLAHKRELLLSAS